MTANNFLVGLIGIGRLKHLPIFIRIIQNIKIQSQVALRAIGRFLILILLIEFAHLPVLWTILKVAITLWFIFVDFKFAFQMDRVTNHGLYFFPKGVHYAIFGLDLLCRISWIFSPTSAVLVGVIRKLLENYGRLEAQAANNKKNTIFKEIMHIAGL